MSLPDLRCQSCRRDKRVFSAGTIESRARILKSSWWRFAWLDALCELNLNHRWLQGPGLTHLPNAALRNIPVEELELKGQCPDYVHARASSVFSSNDNRTVTLTRQDFLPHRTAHGDLLFAFSSNILDFRRSLSSYLKFGWRHEDSSWF